MLNPGDSMPVMRHLRSGDSGLPGLLNGTGHSFDVTKRLYFTIDCDWVPGSQKGLEALLNCCDRYHMAGTVFFTGRFAQAYPDLARGSSPRAVDPSARASESTQVGAIANARTRLMIKNADNPYAPR